MDSRYHKLIGKLIREGVIINNVVRHDVKCGMHSGIKDCCIVYYLTGWKKAMFSRKFSKSGNIVGYIPCLECERKKSYIKYKKCDCRYILKLGKLYKELDIPEGYKFSIWGYLLSGRLII